MILCDNCKCPIDDVKTDSKFIKGQRIDMTYLYCKNCHAKFISYFDDDKTRKLKEDIRHLRDKIFDPAHIATRQRNMATLDTKQKKLKYLTDRARHKYMKYFE